MFSAIFSAMLSAVQSYLSGEVFTVIKRLPARNVVDVGISDDGELIVCGGDEDLRCWRTTDFKCIHIPPSNQVQGTTTGLAWMNTQDAYILVYITNCGFVGTVNIQSQDARALRQPAEFISTEKDRYRELVSCATDSPSSTIAVGGRDGTIDILSLTKRGDITPLRRIPIGETIPVSLLYGKDGVLHALGYMDGRWFRIAKDGGIISTRNIGKSISGAINRKNRLFVNGVDGSIHEFNIASGNVVKAYQPMNVSLHTPKQIRVSEAGDILVIAGEGGKAVVYNRRTGDKIQDIAHSNEGVLSIAVFAGACKSMVVCASKEQNSNQELSIWWRVPPEERRPSVLLKAKEAAYKWITIAWMMVSILAVGVLAYERSKLDFEIGTWGNRTMRELNDWAESKKVVWTAPRAESKLDDRVELLVEEISRMNARIGTLSVEIMDMQLSKLNERMESLSSEMIEDVDTL